MKKVLSIILVFTLCFIFAGCTGKAESDYIPLKLIDEVVDKYDNVLQRTYYNKETGDYILTEYTYVLQQNKWVCIDQQTTIYSTVTQDPGCAYIDPNLSIYYNSDLTDNPITIMNNEYAKISIVKYLAADAWWEFGYELKIYNKTNQVLSVLIDDCYIMDIQCKPLFSIDHIDAGKTAYFKMAWDSETLERCYIPYVDNIEFMIKVFDNSDWTVPALAGTRIMLKK
jgi:hypothetical protein